MGGSYLVDGLLQAVRQEEVVRQLYPMLLTILLYFLPQGIQPFISLHQALCIYLRKLSMPQNLGQYFALLTGRVYPKDRQGRKTEYQLLSHQAIPQQHKLLNEVVSLIFFYCLFPADNESIWIYSVALLRHRDEQCPIGLTELSQSQESLLLRSTLRATTGANPSIHGQSPKWTLLS